MSRNVELIAAIASVILFVGTIAAIPWLVRRLPADYFVRPLPNHSIQVRIARGVVGFTLIGAGIAMLVLPGQGILTILIGLSIVDLPIKHRALGWLLRQPRIRAGIQRLRSRAGKPPLVFPQPARLSRRRSPSRGGSAERSRVTADRRGTP